jgi:hypothetical protein
MKELARHIMVDFLPMKDLAENPDHHRGRGRARR